MKRSLFLILIAGLLLLGCTGPAPPASQPSAPTDEVSGPSESAPAAEDTGEAVDTAPAAETSEEGSALEPLAVPFEGEKVLLLGRSVAYHWTEYLGLEWTCDDEECATGGPRGYYDDRYFIYYELDYPPDIATSAARGVDLYGQDADVVFFKFCFVDFASDEGHQNAKDNIALAEDVYQYVVVDRHKKLIFGNALPQVSQDTDQALLENQKEFDDWLEQFAASHDDIQVLDLNGMLTDEDGNLRSDYAVSSDDSHLSDAGYDRITPQFMALLDQA